jgi:uncharacterized protein YjiS (DUF1127 family)
MIKDSIAQVRPAAGGLTRLLRALAAWRRRPARRRRRHVDCLGDHLRKDVGLAPWEPERRATGRLYRG